MLLNEYIALVATLILAIACPNRSLYERIMIEIVDSSLSPHCFFNQNFGPLQKVLVNDDYGYLGLLLELRRQREVVEGKQYSYKLISKEQ